MEPRTPEFPLRAGHDRDRDPADAGRISRLLESFAIEPTDTHTFRTLEQYLSASGAWGRLAGVYECRIAVLDPDAEERVELLLALGRVLEEQLEDPSSAQYRYEELLRIDPHRPEALARLRWIHTRRGGLAEALQIAELEERLDLDPRDRARLQVEVADLWLAVGDRGECEQRLAAAVAADPEFDDALARLSRIAEDAGRTADVIELEERRLPRLTGSERADSLVRIAGLLAADAAPDDARFREVLRELVELVVDIEKESGPEPGSGSQPLQPLQLDWPQLQAALELALRNESEAGDWDGVDRVYEALWAVRSEESSTRLLERAAGARLNGADDPEGALRWLERARDPSALLELRIPALRRLERTDALLDALERRVDGEGPVPEHLLEIAQLHEQTGRPAAAIDWIERYLAERPRDAEALELLDRCLECAGRYRDRLEVIERRIAVSDSDDQRVELWLDAAELCTTRLRDPERAEWACRRALELQPAHVPTLDRLEAMLRADGRHDAVAELIEEAALRTRAGDEAALLWARLGALHAEKPHPTESVKVGPARGAFARALDCDPHCEAALAGLRRLAETLDDPCARIEVCERELVLDPPTARRAEVLCELVESARRIDEPRRALRAAEEWAELDTGPAALTVLADVARDLGDVAGEQHALETLEGLLFDDPVERAACLTRLAELALEGTDAAALERAAERYRESLDIHPDPAARRELLDLYRRLDRTPDLVAELRRALIETDGTDANRTELELELARALGDLGQPEGAIEVLRPVFARDPARGEVAALLEVSLGEAGDAHGLADVLRARLAAEDAAPRRRELALRLGELLLETLVAPADAAQALAPLVNPREAGPVEALFTRSLELMGDARRLESWFEVCIPHREGEERARLQLRVAHLLQARGRTDEAISALQSAEASAAPKLAAEARDRQLALLRSRGDAAAQLEVLDRVLSAADDPRACASLRVERARLRAHGLRDRDGALEELERALEGDRLPAEGLRLMAALARDAGRNELRARALESLVALASASEEPESAYALQLDLAELYLASGPDDRARGESLLAELLSARPDRLEPFSRLHRLYTSERRTEERLALLEQRVACGEVPDAERDALCVELAELYLDAGRAADAVGALSGLESQPAVAGLLYAALEEAGDLEGRLALCEDRAQGAEGSERSLWLERWLRALIETGAPHEQRLGLVEELALERPEDTELGDFRLRALRQLGRQHELASALEQRIGQGPGAADALHRLRILELAALYEGPLDDPEGALDLIEREVTAVPELRRRGAALASRLDLPEREAELLAPLVEQPGAAPDVDTVRRLALARLRAGDARAEPVLWQSVEAGCRDRELLVALEALAERRDDPAELSRVLALRFEIEPDAERLELAIRGFELAERYDCTDDARAWLRRWRALQPLPADILSRSVRLEEAAGDTAAALGAIAELCEQSDDPEDRAAALAERGRLLRVRGELDPAVSAYQDALRETRAPNVEWLGAVEDLLGRLGRPLERADVLRALRVHPDIDTEERSRRAEQWVELLASSPELREEAALELRMLIDSPAGDRDVLVARMRTLLRIYDELARDLEWCELAERLHPLLPAADQPQLEHALARRLQGGLGARARAITAWERVRAREPESREALTQLSELLDAPGQEAARTEVLEALARIEPDRAVELWVTSARIRWKRLGDANGALAAADLGLSSAGEDAAGESDDLFEAHALRAEVCARLQRPTEEAVSLRALLELARHADEAPARWLRLAHLRAASADGADEAVAAVERALELSPESAGVRREIRVLLERLGCWGRAADLLQKEIEAAPPEDRPALLHWLARVQWVQLRDADAACSTFESFAALVDPEPADRELWAEALESVGRFEDAFAQRRGALEARGAAATADRWLELARDIVARVDDVERARDACDAAIAREPTSAAALELRASLHGRSEDWDREIDDCVALAAALPGTPAAADALSHAAERARDRIGDDRRAARLYADALSHQPSSVRALVGAGELAFHAEEWVRAEEQLGRACALLQVARDRQTRTDPAEVPAPRVLSTPSPLCEPMLPGLASTARRAGLAALRGGHDERGAHFLEIALAEEPHAETLDRLAEACLRVREFARARDCFRQRLALADLDPAGRGERLLGLARAHEGLGDGRETARALESAVECLPDDETVCFQLVGLLERLGENERAVHHLDSWIDRSPPDTRADLLLRTSRRLVDVGRRDEARARLERLVHESPDHVGGWLDLARRTLEDCGPEKAVELCTERLRNTRDDEERRTLLWIEAQAHRALGNSGAAAARANETLELEPGNLSAAVMLGRLLGHVNDWAGAVGRLERAIEVGHPREPVASELWEAIGRACAGPLEDLDRALGAYRRAIEINPLRTRAREALADLLTFDADSHREAVHMHAELLDEFPAREGSWLALSRVAEHWKRRRAEAIAEQVLLALGEARDDSGCGVQLPVGTEPSRHSAVRAATFALRAAADAGELPTQSEGGPVGPLPPAIQQSLDALVGGAWNLPDSTLLDVWSDATGADATDSGSRPLALFSRRTTRAASRSDGLRAGELDARTWRSEVLAHACARALGAGRIDVRAALLGVLEAWPETSRFDLARGGSLSEASQACPPARALLRRLARATLDYLS